MPEPERDEAAAAHPSGLASAGLGNRGRRALLRALSPEAVVEPADSPFERQAQTAMPDGRAPGAVHQGPAADSAARALGALAFTTDGQVFLSSMAHADPAARARVLAHEQMHAVRHPATRHGTPVVYRSAEGEQPSAEQERVATHLAQVMQELPPLSDAELARLDTAAAGTPVLALIRQRHELAGALRQEAASRQSRGMGIAVYSGAAAERSRRLAGLDRDIAEGLAELGVPDQRALLRLVHEQVPAQVLARARQVALAMLARNQETAENELERYGKNMCTPDKAGLLEADRDLQALDVSERIRQYEATMASATNEADIDYMLSRTGSGYVEMVQRQKRYEQLRMLLALQYPLLLSPGYRPGMFVNADPFQLDAVIAKPVTEVLDNIGKVREAIKDDELKVWHIPHAVGTALTELGIADNVTLVRAVEAQIKQIEADKSFWGWVKAAFAIGTTILAGIIFTPAVGALVGAAWGAESLIGNIGQYRVESAAENVSLDPVLADMSMNEPTLLWIVVDIVGLGLDLGPLARALRPAARGVQANPGTATLLRLRDDAIAAGVGPDVAQQMAQRAAQRFGVNADEIIELTPQTRRAAVERPDLLAHYEKLATDRMAAITREVLSKQRSTPGRVRLVALHDEFEMLRRSVGERALTVAERDQAMRILREARDIARDDFGTLRTAIWRRLRKDPELEQVARDMVAAGDAQLGAKRGSVRVKTVWDDGDEAYQALEVEHKVRLSDNPWKYNDPDNLLLTDSAQNQQYLEALRREGGIWATDDIERFVVSHGLLDQSNVGAPRGR